MPNTYTQVHIQFIFAVKFRAAQLLPAFKDELLKYITEVVQSNKHKLLAIECELDHIHIFIGMKPNRSMSDLMREVKTNSSKWINEKKFLPTRFEWQGGFGAFSYCNREVQKIINYVRNQKLHHARKKFLEEYLEFLNEFEIDFDEKYIFREME